MRHVGSNKQRGIPKWPEPPPKLTIVKGSSFGTSLRMHQSNDQTWPSFLSARWGFLSCPGLVPRTRADFGSLENGQSASFSRLGGRHTYSGCTLGNTLAATCSKCFKRTPWTPNNWFCGFLLEGAVAVDDDSAMVQGTRTWPNHPTPHPHHWPQTSFFLLLLWRWKKTRMRRQDA